METGRRLLREAEAEASAADEAAEGDDTTDAEESAGRRQRAARLADRLRLLRVSYRLIHS